MLGVFWDEMRDHLARRKVEVLDNPVETDVSIVLSGLYENPVLLKGKKVLAFKPQEWWASMPPPKGWVQYERILKFYYDEFIDLTGLNAKRSAQKIVKYINEIKESRSQD